jgi:octaheme c-type cytochrome (tetrathionate reductase family)
MKLIWLVSILLAPWLAGQALAESLDPWQFVPERKRPTDHSTFIKGPFADGPSVTRACLECHPKAATDIMQTAHWNLAGDPVQVPGHDEPVRIGKRNLINNFCIGIKSNWPDCTSCHIGFGWKDDTFDLSDESLVDCLVCHEQTGTYHKDAGDAGLPAADVDLLAAARSVGQPTRANCGACHFLGGGGNAVKHGDLDETLLFPNPEIDVHMGRFGFQCIDCHQAEDHLPPGRLLTVSVDAENRLFCTDCHKGDAIHRDRRIDSHTERIACQTCHIPLMSFKTGTKLTWDWSEAGQDLPITDQHIYLKIKGRFTWAKGAQPEYAWYNGTGRRYLLGDKIDPEQVTQIAAPLGDRADAEAKIHPFKIHRGRQVYDTEHRHFILPNTHGDEGFWNRFDWDTALRVGSEVTGLPFSGSYDFAPTEMYIPQNHMVVPKERALQCPDCHGPSSRMDWTALGYDADPLARPAAVHEPVMLFDADGEMVHESGRPLSTATTCGMCHEIEDEAFVATHAYHAHVAESDLEPERRILMEQGPRVPLDETQQMNCFLCHLERPNIAEWQYAIRSGANDWAVAATLVGTEIIQRDFDHYAWNADSLNEDSMAVVPLSRPRPRHCGTCHGLVHTDRQPLTVQLGTDAHWATENSGQVFSAQPMRLSALNLRDKDLLARPWDIHAQRLVECRDCHYSKQPPDHLIGQAESPDAEDTAGLRRCESCHTDGAGHDWLPQQARHFEALSCEACHAPRAHLPARMQVDASLLTVDGDYVVSYRGLAEGSPHDLVKAYAVGFEPLLMQWPNAEQVQKWVPMNIVSRWYWAEAASGEEISKAQLKAALFDAGGYRPEFMAAFDSDGDGRLSPTELRLDSAAKLALVRTLLSNQGVVQPELKASLRAHHIHHGLTLGDARRECTDCHASEPGGAAPEAFALADHLPAGVLPSVLHGVPESIRGQWQKTAEGGLQIIRQAPLSTKKVEP